MRERGDHVSVTDMDKRTIEIPADLSDAIDDAVAGGRFPSREQLIEEALWSYTELDLYSPKAVERFRALLAEGEASGVAEPWDREALEREILDPDRKRDV